MGGPQINPALDSPARPRVLQLADGTVDTAQQTLTRGDRVVHLTTLENEVLMHLWDNPGRTITREELLAAVWGHSPLSSTEPVYSTVKRLRAKIEGPGPHRHIVTVHGDGYRFEPPPTMTAPTVNVPTRAFAPLPSARTRFVGREDELTAIEARLAAGARLVTLVGPGGVGKTRSARELARRRTTRSEPTIFVDLAEARTLEDALRALATALDVPLDGGHPEHWARGLARALSALAPSHALVVLDNVEQLVGALGPAVVLLSDALPIVATSREPLHISGEHALALHPLSRDEAVALFIDRAQMATTFDARLNDATIVATISKIVDHLDRLPLAIELAAARVRLMSPEALLARLSQGDGTLDQLGRAPSDLPLRHATLRAAVTWSWQLLGDDERRVLAHCAVFAGGFSLDAAAAVLDADVTPSIERLCDRSLIRVTSPPDLPSETRFELYTAVQQLAAEQLALLPTSGDVTRRHALWVLDECTRWSADLDGRGHARARTHLELELDNLRHAFETSLAGDAFGSRRRNGESLTAPLARVLDLCLRLRGGAATRRDVLQRALSCAPDDASLQLALGECLAELGDAGASTWLDRAHASATRSNLPDLIALAAAARAELAASRGDLPRALEDFEHALGSARNIGARRAEGRTLTLMGEILWRAGRAPEARAALEAAQTIHQETGDLRHLARTNATLCHVLRAAGQPAQALQLLDHAELLFEALGDPLGKARTLVDRGLHLSRVGRQQDAIDALLRARALYDRLGVLRGHEEVQLNLAEALLGLGEDERALAEVHRAVAVCRELGERLRLSTALELLACAAVLRHDLGAAEGALAEALSIAIGSGNQRSEATILSKRGLCHYLRSRWAESLADFVASAAINHARGEAAMEGTSRADIAVSLAALGRNDESRSESATARQLLGEPLSPHATDRSTWVTRMLTLLEAARDVHLAVGNTRSIVADSLAIRDEVLARMPRDAQDLATRLSCLMLEHALTTIPKA